jgi:hypothetical protein
MLGYIESALASGHVTRWNVSCETADSLTIGLGITGVRRLV